MKILLTLFLLFAYNISIAQNLKPPFSQLDVFELEWASDPQISPDGQSIIYLRNGMDIMEDKRFRRIWMINSDGANHRKLTPQDKNESLPRWSPDGKKIAYTSSSDHGSEIFIYWLETGQHARISQLDRSPGNITWSPDGKWLAFSMKVPEEPPFLAKSPKKPNGANWAEAPRVTTRMKHEADGSGFIEPGCYHYFVIPSEGGSPRQITSGNFQHQSL
ncbi:MAG: S9 family peptidase, partial [Flammeovirgaceae bacterium]|nr:S9 family peptidase [Flammeovirgaceae bacterium]